MYFITLAGRNYNIAVSIRAGAPAGRSAAFTSRLESCNGPVFPIDCDVDINYYYEDVASNSGNRTITLFSGSSSVSEQPTGEILTVLYVNSLTGSGCTAYNQVYDCPGVFPTTTTTTTTISTSTTTTTTTVTPASYPAPIIKYDQYSSSFGPGGNPIWPNIGSGGSTYNMGVGTNSSISALGSGTGQYLRLTGGVQSGGPGGEVVFLSYPALVGPFITLYNKSFSYAIVFRIQTSNLQAVNSISNIYAPDTETGISYASFAMNSYPYSGELTNSPPQISAGIYQYDGDAANAYIAIANTSKWYLAVFTFNKDGGSTNCVTLNLNNNTIDQGSTQFNPSGFFNSVQNSPTYHALAFGTDELDVAAIAFWDSVILTRAQIQSLYSEYNSRYTLG
jgi:hypothetical protein